MGFSWKRDHRLDDILIIVWNRIAVFLAYGKITGNSLFDIRNRLFNRCSLTVAPGESGNARHIPAIFAFLKYDFVVHIRSVYSLQLRCQTNMRMAGPG